MNQDFIYLASASPRRRELLEQIGVSFKVLPANIPEVRANDETVRGFVERMALGKARAVSQVTQGERPVLGADTVVVVDAEMLGKPLDRAEGIAMLEKLSGRMHEVFTAVALVDNDAESVETEVSKVWFANLDAQARAAYWDTGEPADKAGAYAVQGIGAVFVERLEGSFSGVMGLPVCMTARILARHGIQVPVISGARLAHA